MTQVLAKYRGAELGDLPVRFIGAPHVKERLQRAFTHRQRTGETIDADARICGQCANSHAYDTARCQEQTVKERLDEEERRVKLLAEHLRTNPETITKDTEIELAGWENAGGSGALYQSRALALLRLQRLPSPTRSAREIAQRRREEGDG